MVTVVDAFNFFKDFGSADTIVTRKMTNDSEDHRTIVNLLTDQIEFANVIVLNKTDLVPPENLKLLEGLIIKLNPDAKLIRSSFGKVDPKELLNTKMFNYEKAQQSAGWIKELNNQHIPETQEYGISSFVFRSRHPFHPIRFWEFVQHQWPGNVLRSKGIFWIASRPDEVLLWSQAGGSSRAEVYGKWWASMPLSQRAQRDDYLENQDEIQKKWDKTWGDRINEIVIIGQHMDASKIEKELERCLCTDAEMDGIRFRPLVQDPWPF